MSSAFELHPNKTITTLFNVCAVHWGNIISAFGGYDHDLCRGKLNMGSILQNLIFGTTIVVL